MKKTIIIALTLILVLASFTSCENNTHEHTWDKGTVTKAATCTEKGVKTYTCTVCKETKTEDIAIDPENHTWNEGEVTTPATCTEAGEKTITCTGCKKTKSEVIVALGHSWDEGTETTAATCTTDGEKTFTCSTCNKTKTEVIKALGHDLSVTNMTEAGFLTEGLKEVECTRCEYTEESIIEKKSLAGVWLKAKFNEEQDIYFLYPTKESIGKIFYGISTPISINGSNDKYFQIFDTGMDFKAEINTNRTITITAVTAPIDSNTQTIPITEKIDKDGNSTITITGLNGIGPAPIDLTLSPVTAHSFTGETEPEVIFGTYDNESHLEYIICTDLHEENVPKYALATSSSMHPHVFDTIITEPGYFTIGKGENCKVCGYIGEGSIATLSIENTTWISDTISGTGNEDFDGKNLVIEFREEKKANIYTKLKDGEKKLIDKIDNYSLNLDEKTIFFNGTESNYSGDNLEESIDPTTITIHNFTYLKSALKFGDISFSKNVQ